MTQSVGAGILSFTELEQVGHRNYNQWHRYVHMPEEFLVEGVVAAQRLVATPDLLSRRTGSDPALLGAQYFGYYLVAEPARETFEAMEDLGRARRAGGGDLADRRGPTDFKRKGPSGTYRLVGSYSAPGVMSAPAVLPFRPHRGVFVTVVDAVGGGSAEELAESRQGTDGWRPPETLELPGVAGCWSFEAANLMEIPNQIAAPVGRRIHIYWLEGDPVAFLDALESLRDSAEAEAYSTSFTGAFRVIEPDSSFEWFDAG